MPQFWIKFLIVFSSALSAHAVLAVQLSSLLNANYSTPSLLVDKLSLDLTLDESIINQANNAKISHALSELFQHKTIVQLANELQLSMILANEYQGALVHIWMNSVYRRTFQQQKCIYSAIQAQTNTCFHTQASYQAQRQEITPLFS